MKDEMFYLALELMRWQFKGVELALFLDTHPYEKKALADYNETVNKIKELEQKWESKYGPLTSHGHSPSSYPWGWVEQPWPWELGY